MDVDLDTKQVVVIGVGALARKINKEVVVDRVAVVRWAVEVDKRRVGLDGTVVDLVDDFLK
jgi:hypothetical protein